MTERHAFQGVGNHERMMDRTARRHDPEVWSAESARGMVATANYLATAAGAEMLARGGHAADAAVAASLALGVSEPASSGLGGNAMAVVHLGPRSETHAFSGPCRAPYLATPEAIATSPRYRGYRAVAVPTNAAVLEHLHAAYGVLPLSTVFAPAIRLARFGYPQTPVQERLTRRHRRVLASRSAGAVFLDPATGQPHRAGTWIRRPILARTLRRLAGLGFRDFYEGEIAHQIEATMRKHGGFVRINDLAEHAGVDVVVPLRCRFGDAEVYTMPPPAGGITLVQMLQLFDAVRETGLEPTVIEAPLIFAEIIRCARTDRVAFRLKTRPDGIGDAAQLLDRAYAGLQAKELRERIDEVGETSHISVADDQGTFVSLTQSLERSFGAAEIDPDLGFLYNGFMRGFKIQNQRHPHFLAPGVPARSNACPSVLLSAGGGRLAIGSTGSERMASSIFQVLVRLRRQTPFEAVLAPRLHATPTGLLMYEDRFDTKALERLSSRGYELERHDPFSFKFGGLNLVLKDRDSFVGVGEPRRDGAAAGPEDWPP